MRSLPPPVDARPPGPKLIGRIGAGALFAVAERADHIVPLSRHIARLALAGAKDWPEHLRLSLNVTAFELASESYAEQMLSELAASDTSPQRLTLEVTEQALLADIQISAGNNYVAVRVGGDVVVFVDSGNNNGTAEDAIVLVGRTLADVEPANFVT